MFTIGIDPHKGTHTAAVLDGTETMVDEHRLVADRRQRDRLLSFAIRFEPRTWAIDGARGLGVLAQQLVAAGETVLDVPPSLSARVRLLDSTRTDKTDSHDARAAAIVAMRHDGLRRVTPGDHTAVLRLLADRHHDLTRLRTQAICRLHALLCQLTPGDAPGRLSARRAGQILGGIRPLEPVATERKRIALELLGDVRRFDSQLVAQRADRRSRPRLGNHSHRRVRRRRLRRGDHPRPHRRHHPVPRRRPLRPLQRHRTHRRVERAEPPAPAQPTRVPPTQPGPPRRRRDPDRPRHTDGRIYVRRKLAEGKTRKEALRALKRQISNAVYRHLIADIRR